MILQPTYGLGLSTIFRNQIYGLPTSSHLGRLPSFSTPCLAAFFPILYSYPANRTDTIGWLSVHIPLIVGTYSLRSFLEIITITLSENLSLPLSQSFLITFTNVEKDEKHKKNYSFWLRLVSRGNH